MFVPEEESSAREHRLDEVIAEYYQLVERGGSVDPHAFVDRYPELADDLAAFFTDKGGLPDLARRHAAATRRRAGAASRAGQSSAAKTG